MGFIEVASIKRNRNRSWTSRNNWTTVIGTVCVDDTRKNRKNKRNPRLPEQNTADETKTPGTKTLPNGKRTGWSRRTTVRSWSSIFGRIWCTARIDFWTFATRARIKFSLHWRSSLTQRWYVRREIDENSATKEKNSSGCNRLPKQICPRNISQNNRVSARWKQ